MSVCLSVYAIAAALSVPKHATSQPYSTFHPRKTRPFISSSSHLFSGPAPIPVPRRNSKTTQQKISIVVPYPVTQHEPSKGGATHARNTNGTLRGFLGESSSDAAGLNFFVLHTYFTHLPIRGKHVLYAARSYRILLCAYVR